MSKDSETQHRLGPQRNPAIDDAVLDATRQLLEEKGYAGTSIDAIATRAGVGRPAIYRRWPSKAHIVNDAIYPVLDVEQGADIDTDSAPRARSRIRSARWCTARLLCSQLPPHEPLLPD